ncbi:MAG TPA: GNAT family N-acetyltransferase [Haliangiales bacterium]|nr:GNAT family N-acetyltransferase [Haliangiales bacterium]
MLSLARETLLSDVAQALIARLNAELDVQYPEEGANHFRLDPDEVSPGRGVFLVARLDGEPVGCGALRRLDDTTAELKRMFVDPATRGRGVGRALLDALEREAAALGVRRLVLETGERQREALALYRRSGFVPTAPWGDYIDSPLSLCMEKVLPG